jgi:hypothetical protein
MKQPALFLSAFRPASVLGTAAGWSRFGINTHSKHAPPFSSGI